MKIWFALFVLLLSSTLCQARTVDDVKASGVLACGVVADRPGFSMRDKDYQWSGFDVDICRAIAAATIGDPGKVNFVALAESELIVALQSGEVDVVPRGPALTLSDDTTQGLVFVTPTFFDESTSGSVEIFGPFVRQGDDNWLQIVRWTVWCLIRAEMLAIRAETTSAELTKEQVDFLEVGQADSSLSLGLNKGWSAKVVKAVGNYSDVFERHLGAKIANPVARGMNRLSKDGGLLLSPAFN